MKVLIIGSHGKVGKLIVKEAVAKGMDVYAMIRWGQQTEEMEELGAKAIVADLESDFEHAFQGIETVVFTAGSGSKTGPDKTVSVDQEGAIKSIDLAKKSNIKHYVMISARGAKSPEAPSKIQHYFKAKRIADDFLIQSGVPYTILRPGRLLDEKGNATIEIGEEVPGGTTTHRNDLALATVACLRYPHKVINKTIEIFTGKTPIDEAILNK